MPLCSLSFMPLTHLLILCMYNNSYLCSGASKYKSQLLTPKCFNGFIETKIQPFQYITFLCGLTFFMILEAGIKPSFHYLEDLGHL